MREIIFIYFFTLNMWVKIGIMKRLTRIFPSTIVVIQLLPGRLTGAYAEGSDVLKRKIPGKILA